MRGWAQPPVNDPSSFQAREDFREVLKAAWGGGILTVDERYDTIEDEEEVETNIRAVVAVI